MVVIIGSEFNILRLFQSIGIEVRMPEDISKQFRKKISLKEFEVFQIVFLSKYLKTFQLFQVTNTANSGGEYSQGWDVKEAGKKLKIKVMQFPNAGKYWKIYIEHEVFLFSNIPYLILFVLLSPLKVLNLYLLSIKNSFVSP